MIPRCSHRFRRGYHALQDPAAEDESPWDRPICLDTPTPQGRWRWTPGWVTAQPPRLGETAPAGDIGRSIAGSPVLPGVEPGLTTQTRVAEVVRGPVVAGR